MIEIARLHKIENGTSLKAYVDVIVNEALLVKGISVVKNKNGELFVAMPKEQGKDGKWYQTVRFLDKEQKQVLTDTVLEAYRA